MLVAIDECFRLDGSQLHLLNQAFLVLLPKKDAALDLADFRAGLSRFSPDKLCAQLPQASCKGGRESTSPTPPGAHLAPKAHW